MQRKLKSVFRRSSKSSRSSEQHEHLENNNRHTKVTTSHGGRSGRSLDQRASNSIDSSTTGSIYTGRSRPVSSIYDDLQHQAHTDHALSDDKTKSSELDGGDIAKDYKAYLPVLSPVNDEHGHDYTTPKNRGVSQKWGHNGSKHEEDVADRNIKRYSGNSATERSSFCPGATKVNERPRVSDIHRAVSDAVQEPQSGFLPATIDGTSGGHETALAKQLREGGVADLRETVDTDGDIKWAPGTCPME